MPPVVSAEPGAGMKTNQPSGALAQLEKLPWRELPDGPAGLEKELERVKKSKYSARPNNKEIIIILKNQPKLMEAVENL